MRPIVITATLIMLGLVVNSGYTLPQEANSAGIPPLPLGLSSFGAAVLGEYIYVFGGHSGRAHHYYRGNVHGQLYRLNWRQPKEWQPLQADTPGQGLALVAARGSLYRIGGMQPLNAENEPTRLQSLRTFARYDVAANKWERLPDLPEPRSSLDAAVLGDRIFVFGGWYLHDGEQTWHEHGLVFDLAHPEQGWQRLPQPFRRRALAVVAYEEQIYVLGGLSDDGQVSLEVNVFDPKHHRWGKGPSLPDGRGNGFGCAACVAGGRLYISPADGRIYQFRDERWHSVGQVIPARAMHRMVAQPDGLLCLLGGSPRQDANKPTAEMLRLVQIWRPSP
ncbi:MAG: hypothetical protein NZM42_01285 [Gemmatales bacterium]|nr:hypothetical protein [Gemmatales bacterium]MDW8221452.1 hypothetical protein [Gemmatales bacterium]